MKKLIGMLMLLLMATGILGYGMGVAPATLDFKQILRNIEYTRQVNLQNTAPYQAVTTITLENYNDWYEFEDLVVIPPAIYENGVYKQPGKLNVPFKIKVPRKTDLGIYTTKATALIIDYIEDEEPDGIPINIGVSFHITADVTNEKIYDGRIDYILTRDVFLGEDLNIRVGYSNYGNVDNNVIVETIITKQGNIIDSFKDRFFVNAYSDELLISTYEEASTRLSKGFYYANVKVYMRSGWFRNTLIGEKSVHFSVWDYENPY